MPLNKKVFNMDDILSLSDNYNFEKEEVTVCCRYRISLPYSSVFIVGEFPLTSDQSIKISIRLKHQK